jgi:transposase
MALKVRPLTAPDASALARLAHSRTAPRRVGQRAPIIWASAQGEMVPASARQVGPSAFRVRAWLHRFHRHGLAGLADAPRSGRPRQHDETVRGTVIALARTKPRRLGLPCALWTMARWQQALQARHGRHVTPATIWKWLQAEGLVWKRQHSWFQVPVDRRSANKGEHSPSLHAAGPAAPGHRPRHAGPGACQDLLRRGVDVRSRPGDRRSR